MAVIGYARVSSSGQSLEVQLEQLQAAGCEKVFAEKRRGTSTEGREQLALALDYVREGDVFVVTRLDRLARSVADLTGIIRRLTEKGVSFQCVQQREVDTTTTTGRMVLNIMAAVAEFETDLRRERQLEGIAKAKERGVYKGRKPSVDIAEVRRLKTDGVRPSEIARRLNIARSSVYEALKVWTGEPAPE